MNYFLRDISFSLSLGGATNSSETSITDLFHIGVALTFDGSPREKSSLVKRFERLLAVLFIFMHHTLSLSSYLYASSVDRRSAFDGASRSFFKLFNINIASARGCGQSPVHHLRRRPRLFAGEAGTVRRTKELATVLVSVTGGHS